LNWWILIDNNISFILVARNLDASADWALVGQVLMSLPQLQELDLSCWLNDIFSFYQVHFLFLSVYGRQSNDEWFMAIAEGLMALRELRRLELSGVQNY
jgi:hypothetical protein